MFALDYVDENAAAMYVEFQNCAKLHGVVENTGNSAVKSASFDAEKRLEES